MCNLISWMTDGRQKAGRWRLGCHVEAVPVTLLPSVLYLVPTGKETSEGNWAPSRSAKSEYSEYIHTLVNHSLTQKIKLLFKWRGLEIDLFLY